MFDRATESFVLQRFRTSAIEGHGACIANEYRTARLTVDMGTINASLCVLEKAPSCIYAKAFCSHNLGRKEWTGTPPYRLQKGAVS